jgi:hypothetical protein
MSRWFRFYDEALNDPKVQRLQGEAFKAWVNLLCLASKNDGILPPIGDIAFALRLDEDAVSSLLNDFYSLQLLDEVERNDAPIGYTPHNWTGRQYKTDNADPTNSKRQQRFRARKRNGKSNGTVTAEKRPDTEQIQKQIQKDSEAKASGADAPIDPSIAERDYFTRGREVLGKNAGGLLAKLLRTKGNNVALARSAVEMAATKQSPLEYVAGVIRGPPVSVKPLTEFQRKQAETNDVRAMLRNGGSGESGGSAAGVLSDHHGERPEAVRNSDGPAIRLIPGRSG